MDRGAWLHRHNPGQRPARNQRSNEEGQGPSLKPGRLRRLGRSGGEDPAAARAEVEPNDVGEDLSVE